MPHYIVNQNAQSNGDHEIHNETTGCSHMPDPANRKSLGYFDNCHQAKAKAKLTDPSADGCYYCCNECHTR